MPDVDPFAAALMGLMEQTSRLVSAAAGHKREAVEAGFSDESAEVMATELHGAMVRMMFKTVM